MSRYTGPKIRLSRRFGVQLFGRKDDKKIKKYNTKKTYPPGQHGQSRIGKMSEYGKQLMEKQKAKILYGVTERQIRNYYKKASSAGAVKSEELMSLLERRLDNVIYQAGIAKTRPQARQIVNHALVKLNGRKVNIPSIQVKKGDTFEIHEKSKKSPLFADIEKAKINPARWIKMDFKALKGEIVALPEKEDFEKIIDPQIIVEYFSK